MSLDPRVSIGTLAFLAPRGDAAKELVAVLERRESLVAKLDDLDRQQRAATEAAAEASGRLAQLERRALGGEKIAAAERRRLEDALAAARATAGEPWAERRAGAREAVADCQREVQAHVSEHLGELLDELGEDGERAARAVDAGAAAIIDAYAERARVEQAITALAAMVRRLASATSAAPGLRSSTVPRPNCLPVVVKMLLGCSSIRGRPGTALSSSRSRCRRECSAGPELESLRSDIAAARGLGTEAAAFLTGSALEEIEVSADALARLIGASGEHRRQESSAAGPGLFSGMAESKARRKQALAALFCGRAPQPRDESGRYARKAVSFDGSARASLPVPKSPEQHTASCSTHSSRQAGSIAARASSPSPRVASDEWSGGPARARAPRAPTSTGGSSDDETRSMFFPFASTTSSCVPCCRFVHSRAEAPAGGRRALFATCPRRCAASVPRDRAPREAGLASARPGAARWMQPRRSLQQRLQVPCVDPLLVRGTVLDGVGG